MCEHSCELCNYTLAEQASQIFDELPSLAIYVKDEIKSNLFYIAGYITNKVGASVEDSFMFKKKYGSYTKRLSRGGLMKPGDSTCEWSVFCFIMFDEIKIKICRNCPMKVFQDIADHFVCRPVIAEFWQIHSSICIVENLLTPLSRKESQQKIIKLS